MPADPPALAGPLPNWPLASIPPAKLRDYALNPAHPHGRHKARVFAAALGYTHEHWPALRDAILAALPAAPARLTRITSGGTSYEVILRLAGPNGQTASVLTAWVVPDPADPESTPRLITTDVTR
jgi:hypothetical protein